MPPVAAPRRAHQLQRQQRRRFAALPGLVEHVAMLAALDIDWSDPDVQTGAVGGVLGLALGIGMPIFYTLRSEVCVVFRSGIVWDVVWFRGLSDDVVAVCVWPTCAACSVMRSGWRSCGR